MRRIFARNLPADLCRIAARIPRSNLSQGGSLLTATGNDYGFEEIFARQVRAFGKADDLLVAITTSGKSREHSPRALDEARNRKLKTIALLGRDGGSAARRGRCRSHRERRFNRSHSGSA